MLLKNFVNVLNKIFVKEFYRMNSGFFLLVGGLTFGFMSDVEHKALAQFFISDPSALIIPILVWVTYTFKILSFNIKQLRQDENMFIFNVSFLPTGLQFFVTTIFFYLQFMPALGYGAFLMLIAWSLSLFKPVMIIGIVLTGCGVTGTLILMSQYRCPYLQRKVFFIQQFIDRIHTRPVIQFYVEGLLLKYPLMIAGTKIFSGALVLAVCHLYGDEAGDWRLMAMALTTCGLANLLIIFQLLDYEHRRISWIKNLPIKMGTRYLQQLITLILFLIPEIVLLARNFPAQLDTVWLVENIAYLCSLAAFFLGFLQTRAAPMEYFTKKSFFFFIAVVLLILFQVPLGILSLLNIAVGYYLFNRNYYLFEPTVPSRRVNISHPSE